MPHDQDDTPKAEPIPLHEERDKRRSEPDPPDIMSVDEALELIGVVEDEMTFEDVGRHLRDDALEAAAVLRSQSPADFQALHVAVRSSQADTNYWKGLVKDKQRSLQTSKRRGTDHRPSILDRADLHEMVDQACNALSDLGGIYEHGGELVEVLVGSDGPKMQNIEKGRVRELLSRAARFEKSTSEGKKPIKPPSSIVDSVHARGSWGLDELRGFVEGAAFLEDGDILCTDGYHPSAGLYVRRAVDVTGLQSPSRKDAIEARKRLVDLLCDFELDHDQREGYEASWLACLLTILARPAIGDGCTPMFLFDANQPRVGKTRLAEMAVEIATGREPSPQAAPTGRDSDAEMRKTITGIARSGIPVVFFDNVKGKLGGASLELAITARRWSDRILGESTQYEGGLEVTWVATSNNAQLTPDMHGRTLLCRIKSETENPENRTGFKYPRIMAHVREHRSQYLKDALTILRAWHVDGRPDAGLTPWGSFESWGDIVRNAIVFAGGADPCQARSGLIEADSETRGARAVITNWPAGKELTSADVADAMKEGYISESLRGSHQAFIQSLKEFFPKASPRSIGYRLGTWKGRPVDGRRLVREDNSNNVYVWKVERIDQEE